MEATIQNRLQIGQPAPNFDVDAIHKDGAFKKVSLSDYKGKWVVLFFYPLDFTFVCPTEIRGFNAKHEEFRKLNAVVLGASTDSVYSHKAWMESGLGKLEFPLLGDTNHKLSRDYQVLIPEKGISFRGTFVIDPNGILRSYVVNDLPVGRSVDETIRTVKALQTGELVQCDWKPGEKTLGKA